MNLGSKDGSVNNPRPKINSSIMSAAGLAFNQAKNQDFHNNTLLADKVPTINSLTLADSLKAFNTEVTEFSNQSDNTGSVSGSSSDETESSNSSITRVEQRNTVNRPKARTDSIMSSNVSNATGGHSDDVNQHKNTEKDNAPKKARAKVSANMIITDFNSIRLPHKQGQNDDSTLFSPTIQNQLENKHDNRSEVSRSSDLNRNNTARKPRVNATMIHEESESSHYRRQNTNFDDSSRKVFFNPNSDSSLNYARSDVSWGSDPGQSTNTKKSILKSNDDIIHQYNHVNSPFNANEWTTSSRSSKVKAKPFVEFNDSTHYQNDSFSHNVHYQMNPRYNTRSPPSTPKTWSDVAYRQVEARTELSNISDPGPPGHLRRTSDNILSRVPDAIDEHGTFDPNYQPIIKSRRPRVSADSIVDVTSIQSNPRKVVTYAQGEDGGYETEDKNNYDDDEPADEDEENSGEEQDEEDQEELNELMSLSSDPKIQRKFLDLRISNKSLMSINATLTATVENQSNKIANLTSFESIVSSQQQQLDHMIKIEELLRAMSNKISEQESDIKSLKCQIGEASEEKQKNSVNNSHFECHFLAYDDVTVLFTVITSLLYTIYIFPVIVLAKSAKRLAEKSRAKIQEITG
ncbi:11770_t:CDS:2 [Scutellospora calospora]|uniref:11770_t:CDS:1 n=1 Tax=Scutellospora calospora TaxID=85575 RepID=A0ACA9KBX2_9GLOM|nr:11770_t:CDS:2 [Scutellospora calospora]